ncbi:hypothetical protein FB45DRAFT_193965 [Roridomyces roridus]|uniref:DUF6533 domain-containing protein n=1 Tax=Roridomyces roridus TaxID=1738132 RepID=A0AAD7CF34_9AGAR|nr:hypothetical protein FB45DRAFT_193965 [Roridomyces roridus]
MDNELQVDLHRTSIGALAFLLWEFMITFDDEVHYIWPKPNTAWIKADYLFLRYFPLSVQLCNRVLDELVFQGHQNLTGLRAWYICQVVVAHLTMMGVEIIMMARVYALYHNNRWVGWGFLALLGVETCIMVLGLVLTIPGVHFKPQTWITNVPHSFAYIGISALFSQAVILTLTIIRYIRGEWSGTSWGSLLMREGSVVFLIFFVTTAAAVVYSIRAISFGMTEYAWYLSIIPTCGCRLIINMQRLPSSGGSNFRSHTDVDFELTTLHNNTFDAP